MAQLWLQRVTEGCVPFWSWESCVLATSVILGRALNLPGPKFPHWEVKVLAEVSSFSESFWKSTSSLRECPLGENLLLISALRKCQSYKDWLGGGENPCFHTLHTEFRINCHWLVSVPSHWKSSNDKLPVLPVSKWAIQDKFWASFSILSLYFYRTHQIFIGFPRKCSQQFWDNHNLYITTTLKHDLFPLLVHKEDFWKEKSFVWIFSEPLTSLNRMFGKSPSPESCVLTGPARSFPSLVEGAVTSFDVCFTAFGFMKSWHGGSSSEYLFLWYSGLSLQGHVLFFFLGLLLLHPFFCHSVFRHEYFSGSWAEDENLDWRKHKLGLKVKTFSKFTEWPRVRTREGGQVRVDPQARFRRARGQGWGR